MQNIIIICLACSIIPIIGACCFFIGYIMGRGGANNGVLYSGQKLYNQENKIKSSLNIDDTKIVSAINTDGMEKKYSELGNIKTSEENISESISRLKNIKR